jgi:hypothetical protein
VAPGKVAPGKVAPGKVAGVVRKPMMNIAVDSH